MKRKTIVAGRYPKYTASAAKDYAQQAVNAITTFLEYMDNNPNIHGCLTDRDISIIDEAKDQLFDYIWVSGS